MCALEFSERWTHYNR